MSVLSMREERIDLTIQSLLSGLKSLSLCLQGLPVYYKFLLQSEDIVLRVAAMSALLELDALNFQLWPTLMSLAKHSAVRERAISYFLNANEYEWAEKILAQRPSDDRQKLLDEFHNAQVQGKDTECAKLARALFLAEGKFEWLGKAQKYQEAVGGWRLAIGSLVEAIMSLPSDPVGPFMLLDMLANANEYELVEHVISVFQEAGVYAMECAVFSAKSEIRKGLYRQALKSLPRNERSISSEALLMAHWETSAQAHRGMKQFREALQCYNKKNEVGIPKNIRAEGFYEGVLARAALKIEGVGADPQSAKYSMMVGFPRSGTTLLENALSSHPAIETFEEIPAFARMERYIHRLGRRSVSAEDVVQGREVYYKTIERFHKKTGTAAFVDKMPITSAHAVFLHKLLPEQKYIFSIRHPYDVVLSCLFQSFNPNITMENFRTFGASCRLYDFTMSQWFSVFSLNHRQVQYVRYETLVNEFEDTMAGTCQFLGVDWDPMILQFAENAQFRPMRTPSYPQVRAGISIGVQSYWKDFDFMFTRKEAECLKKWVKHFDYDS